jgi:predicted RecA/RadA family phage recombinase
MSVATFWQRGESIDWTNTSTSTVAANTIVVLGKRIGIVGSELAPSELGSLHVSGVFKMPKDAAAVTAGAIVYYNATNGTVSATSGDSSIEAGYAVEDAAAGDSTVAVKINA